MTWQTIKFSIKDIKIFYITNYINIRYIAASNISKMKIFGSNKSVSQRFPENDH